MRKRHFTRLCGSCDAPMARQEDTCSRWDADWNSKDKPRLALRVIPGGAQTPQKAARANPDSYTRRRRCMCRDRGAAGGGPLDRRRRQHRR
jgi:hypothetical protein